jgi:hypothetical protein
VGWSASAHVAAIILQFAPRACRDVPSLLRASVPEIDEQRQSRSLSLFRSTVASRIPSALRCCWFGGFSSGIGDVPCMLRVD